VLIDGHTRTRRYDPTTRPNSFRVDLEDQTAEVLWKANFWAAPEWSPDGRRILVDRGTVVRLESRVSCAAGNKPNDYDTQHTSSIPATKTVDAITKGVWSNDRENAFWRGKGGDIYFVAEETDTCGFSVMRENRKSSRRSNWGAR